MARKLSNPAFSPLEKYFLSGDSVDFSDDSTDWVNSEVEAFRWRGVDFSINLNDLSERKPQQSSILMLASLGMTNLTISRLLFISPRTVEERRRGLRTTAASDFNPYDTPPALLTRHCIDKGYLVQESLAVAPDSPLSDMDKAIIRGVAADMLNDHIVYDMYNAGICRASFSARDLMDHMGNMYEQHELPGRQSLPLFGVVSGVLSPDVSQDIF